MVGARGRPPVRRLALELYESLGDRAQQANMLNNLAGEAFFDGHWTDALDMYARATAGYEAVGNQLGVLTAQYNQAEILSRQRHYASAQTHLLKVRRDAGGFGDPDLAATAARELGRLLVLTGKVAEGRATLDQARDDFVAMGESYEVLATDLEIAAAELATGDLAAALAGCDDVRRARRRWGSTRCARPSAACAAPSSLPPAGSRRPRPGCARCSPTRAGRARTRRGRCSCCSPPSPTHGTTARPHSCARGGRAPPRRARRGHRRGRRGTAGGRRPGPRADLTGLR